jgi:hypothetical protein
VTEAVLVVRDALRPPHVIEPVDDRCWWCGTCNLTFYIYPGMQWRQGCTRELLWRVQWPR